MGELIFIGPFIAFFLIPVIALPFLIGLLIEVWLDMD